MGIRGEDHLDRLAAEAEGIGGEVRALTDGLTPDQLLWRPAPERWGIADCLEHLIATAAAYHPRIRAALERAPRADRSDLYRPRLFGRLFIRASGPEGKLRIRARGPFVPPPAGPDTPDRFLSRQAELLELVRASRGADLNRTRIRSPLSRFLSLTLGECLEMLVAHQRRHLQQAGRVRDAPGFAPAEP